MNVTLQPRNPALRPNALNLNALPLRFSAEMHEAQAQLAEQKPSKWKKKVAKYGLFGTIAFFTVKGLITTGLILWGGSKFWPTSCSTGKPKAVAPIVQPSQSSKE